MTMNLEEPKEAGDSKESQYPLEKYIKHIPTIELSVDFSTLGKFPLSEEDLMKLQEIKELVKLAEKEINVLSSKSSRQDDEVFHIEKPNYFDDDFDQDKYVRDLVNAKFHGMKIIEHENAATKVQKILMLKKAIDKNNEEESESSEAITIHSTPKVYQVKMKNNINKNNQNKIEKSNDVEKNIIEKESKSENIVKVVSREVIQQRGEKLSSERINKISKSNHKIFEIKSMENEQRNVFSNQLAITKMPGLSVEIMPSINIRSQLIEQKIPSLDIFPTDKNNSHPTKANNIALVSTEHEDVNVYTNESKSIEEKKKIKQNVQVTTINQSESNVDAKPLTEDQNVSFKTQQMTSESIDKSKYLTKTVKDPNDQSFMFLNRKLMEPMNTNNISRKISKLKKYGIPEIQQIYNPKTQIYKRCPNIYSRPTTSYNKYLSNISKQPVFLRKDGEKYRTDQTLPSTSYTRKKLDTESKYIPYSKLTIGGYKADEVERIIRNKSTKTQPPFQNVQVIQDEESEHEEESEKISVLSETESESDQSEKSQRSQISGQSLHEKYIDDFENEYKSDNSEGKISDQYNLQFKKRKTASLGFKSKVDVFDFVNYVETKDDSTQSSPVKSVSYRETQTSPEQSNDAQIHESDSQKDGSLNKIKSIDANNITLADMVQIQKVLSTLNSQLFTYNYNQAGEAQTENQEGKLNKVVHNPVLPSSSSSQKDTQTSPSRNKHVMTSPAKMVGKILSPVFDEMKVDAETSPWDYESHEHEDELHRKPTTEYPEVVPGTSQQNVSIISPKKFIPKDSTDACTDVSHSESSETHSLGEINLSILRKKSFIIRKHKKSDSVSTSLGMSSSSDVQLDSSNYFIHKKSDGEISEGQILKDM